MHVNHNNEKVDQNRLTIHGLDEKNYDQIRMAYVWSREQQNDVKCLFRWCWQKSGTQITGPQ